MTTDDTTNHTTKSNVQPAETIPTAPFYGSKVVEIKDLTKVFAFINETALFKGQWQYKQGRKSPEEYQKIFEETVYPKFAEIKAKAIREKLLEAKLVYGYFPCQSRRQRFNHLRRRRNAPKEFVSHFRVNRLNSAADKILCLADYFASKDSGKIDVVPFHLVTMGRRASEHSGETFCKRQLHRLSFVSRSIGRIGGSPRRNVAQTHPRRTRLRRRRRERFAKLFHQGYQGSRYSFGYPACPHLEDQTKLFELLQPERIDVESNGRISARPRTINFGDYYSSSRGEVF